MSEAVAVIVGASGGIGSALCKTLNQRARFDQVIELNRQSLNLCDEASIARAAKALPARGVQLIVNAVGFLHDDMQFPEKNLGYLNSTSLAYNFAVNAIGPALLMKHFFPLLPRDDRAVFANLSARVGSIEDNRLGGWYGYRSSKAALNQLVRTAAIELARTHPHAICVALHPGTVATKLSEPFVNKGQSIFSPSKAAQHLLTVIENLEPQDTGNFYDWRGNSIPW